MKTIANVIVEKVITTTDDTYETLVGSVYNLPIIDRNDVLKQLERPFSELVDEFIIPILYPKDLLTKENNIAFKPHYNKEIDKINVCLINNEDYVYTYNWLIRKEIEIDEILLIRGINRIKFEEINLYKSIYVHLNFNQTKDLYTFLFDKYISKETKFDTFFNALSGKLFRKPNSIIWKGEKLLFHYFINLLQSYGFYNRSDDNIAGIIPRNLLFIDSKTNKAFDNIRSRSNKIEENIVYLEENNKKFQLKNDTLKNMKNYDKIKELDLFIDNLRFIK